MTVIGEFTPRGGRVQVDLEQRLVRVRGQKVHLTPTEYRMLEAMATHPGKLLTHQWLLREVWGPGYASESHYLRVYVKQLRKKLKDRPSSPRWITTEPGLGYRWLQEPIPDAPRSRRPGLTVRGDTER